MRWAVLVGVLTLAGCSSAGAKAEREYDLARKAGFANRSEECERMRPVVEGYLKDGNERAYADWKLRAGALCARAETEAYLRAH